MATRLEKLKVLESFLYDSMQAADEKYVAAIAKQYRETIREIENIEGVNKDGNEVSKILSARKADGKSGSVR